MANQYRSALDEVVEELLNKLEYWNISVDPYTRTVSWKGIDRHIPQGSDKRECRQILKKFIVAAEKEQNEVLFDPTLEHEDSDE